MRHFLHKLKPKKTNGLEVVPAQVQKICAHEVAEPLRRLVSLCFRCVIQLSSWKIAHVVATEIGIQERSCSSPSIYGPISHFINVSKVMEAIVNRSTLKCLEHNNVSVLHTDLHSPHMCTE